MLVVTDVGCSLEPKESTKNGMNPIRKKKKKTNDDFVGKSVEMYAFCVVLYTILGIERWLGVIH